MTTTFEHLNGKLVLHIWFQVIDMSVKIGRIDLLGFSRVSLRMVLDRVETIVRDSLVAAESRIGPCDHDGGC